MKQRQPANNKPDEIAFTTINREIDLLLKRLAAKGICPCCTARGLMWRGVFLHADAAGPESTVALCLDIADSIQPDDVSNTQH